MEFDKKIPKERWLSPENSQKIIDDLRLMINLLESTPNHTSKFKQKSWIEINDESRGMYNTNSQINFEKLLKLLDGKKIFIS